MTQKAFERRIVMRKLSRQTKRDLVAYSFIAPNFIGFCVFTLIPIIFAFALAFMKWDGSNPIQWAGISNFTRLWKDTFFIAAFKNTIIYCIGTVPLTMIASLALAIVLNQKVIGRGIFRTLSFFPYVASLVAITAVWKMLFHPSKGPVNNILLNVFNVPQDQLPQWFTGGLVLFSMILFSVWKYMGYYMVIYLAGLQGISSELYEAASLDGANTWQKFRYVTWPQLSSTTFFVVVMLTINCFKVYDIAIMLAGGGSGELTTGTVRNDHSVPRSGKEGESIMAILALKVLDKDSNTICVSSGEDFVDLVCTHTYEEGDRIVLETDEKNIHVHLQVDDALGDAFVYITDNVSYYVPFGEKRISMSPKVFSGNKHYLYAEVAREDEITVYRNLALNPADQHMDVPCYPHATANVETRGESVFAAKNAIDGVRANLSHGEWPYESWGINMQDDAAMKLDFGRPVLADRIVLYTRSDFPHDNWWQQVTIRFSDGSEQEFPLEKSSRAHVLPIPEKEITWLELCNLIKAEDPSPFPALSQIEVYGRVKR